MCHRFCADKTEVKAATLRAIGIECVTAYDGALNIKVSYLPVRYAKGLEVEVAIVLKPAEIIKQTDWQIKIIFIFVTLLFAVSFLLHSEPLATPYILGFSRRMFCLFLLSTCG